MQRVSGYKVLPSIVFQGTEVRQIRLNRQEPANMGGLVRIRGHRQLPTIEELGGEMPIDQTIRRDL